MAGPGVLYQTGDHASRPASGAGAVLYYCTDHSKVYRDNGSSWSDWLTVPAAGAVATDAIWDAAGDLAVGSGANTAARLAKGAAGGALSIINDAVAWNSGTSFPGSKLTGDRYWRTDLGVEFYWDGTNWLSEGLEQLALMEADQNIPHTVSSQGGRSSVPVWAGSDIYLGSTWTSFFIAGGGSALSGSHKWVGTLAKQPAGTTLVTITIDSGASGAWRRTASQSIAALLGLSTQFELDIIWVKTGTPGDLYIGGTNISYQYVAT